MNADAAPVETEAAHEVLADSFQGNAVRGHSPKTRVGFVAADILGCVRVDLTRPANKNRFEFGEIGRRLHRASAGLPAGSTLQIVVSESTPAHEAQLPAGVRVQVVAPDAATLRRWLTALSTGV